MKRQNPIEGEVTAMERITMGYRTLLTSIEWDAMGSKAVERLLRVKMDRTLKNDRVFRCSPAHPNFNMRST
jgi:hypothetical protein